MPTRELIRLARDDGAFHSQNTFDRARKLADAESIRPSDLRAVLGPERFAEVSEEERRVFWVRVLFAASAPAPAGGPVAPCTRAGVKERSRLGRLGRLGWSPKPSPMARLPESACPHLFGVRDGRAPVGGHGTSAVLLDEFAGIFPGRRPNAMSNRSGGPYPGSKTRGRRSPPPPTPAPPPGRPR
jgi:hypothetical protein